MFKYNCCSARNMRRQRAQSENELEKKTFRRTRVLSVCYMPCSTSYITSSHLNSARRLQPGQRPERLFRRLVSRDCQRRVIARRSAYINNHMCIVSYMQCICVSTGDKRARYATMSTNAHTKPTTVRPTVIYDRTLLLSSSIRRRWFLYFELKKRARCLLLISI